MFATGDVLWPNQTFFITLSHHHGVRLDNYCVSSLGYFKPCIPNNYIHVGRIFCMIDIQSQRSVWMQEVEWSFLQGGFECSFDCVPTTQQAVICSGVLRINSGVIQPEERSSGHFCISCQMEAGVGVVLKYPLGSEQTSHFTLLVQKLRNCALWVAEFPL